MNHSLNRFIPKKKKKETPLLYFAQFDVSALTSFETIFNGGANIDNIIGDIVC